MINWKTVIALVVAVGVMATVVACQGYTFEDYIQVPVPEDIQESTGSQDTVPLSKAPFVREKYVNNVTTNVEEFDLSIEDAQFFTDSFRALLNMGWVQLQESGPLASIPAGGITFGILTYLAGLFQRKPGTQKEIDAAWDESARVTRESILEGAKNAKAE